MCQRFWEATVKGLGGLPGLRQGMVRKVYARASFTITSGSLKLTILIGKQQGGSHSAELIYVPSAGVVTSTLLFRGENEMRGLL